MKIDLAFPANHTIAAFAELDVSGGIAMLYLHDRQHPRCYATVLVEPEGYRRAARACVSGRYDMTRGEAMRDFAERVAIGAANAK